MSAGVVVDVSDVTVTTSAGTPLDDRVAAARQVIAAKLDPGAEDPSTDELLAALAAVVGAHLPAEPPAAS